MAVAMQDVVGGEADGAVDLVGDGGAGSGSLPCPHLGGGDIEKGISEVAAGTIEAQPAACAATEAAAASPARRARLCCTAWNFAMARPKASRSWA